MHCSATVLNASIQMDTARVSCVLPALEGFLHSGPDVVLQIKKDNRHSKNHKAFMRNTFFIFTSVTVNKIH